MEIKARVTVEKQAQGFGKIVQRINIEVNVSAFNIKEETQRFILSLKINIPPDTYDYSAIYSGKDINDNGEIVIQELAVIGPVNVDGIEVSASIVYLI